MDGPGAGSLSPPHTNASFQFYQTSFVKVLCIVGTLAYQVFQEIFSTQLEWKIAKIYYILAFTRGFANVLKLSFYFHVHTYCDKRSNFNMKFVFLRRIIKTLLYFQLEKTVFFS
jgi:hypothetical protein